MGQGPVFVIDSRRARRIRERNRALTLFDRLDDRRAKFMLMKQFPTRIATKGRGTYEITEQVRRFVTESGVQAGMCNLFLHHTSASLILCENYEPEVRRDLEVFFAMLAPDGDKRFIHRDEGPDDMPAHIRSILTTNSLVIPVLGRDLDLGTWQGVYVYEHRHAPHNRRLTVSVWGASEGSE
jgi:secondary thiamine-phosphate synthase enzyme